MTNEADNPERIEREIEQDRDALRRTLNDLQGELSLDGFTRRVTDQLRENGGEWADSISRAARANPVALALTGVGLAWLMFGRGYDPTHRAAGFSGGSRGGDDWRRPAQPSAVRASGGPVLSSGSVSGAPRRGSSTTNTGNSDDDSDHGESVTEKLGNKVHNWCDSISRKSGSMTDGLRRNAHDWRNSISDTSGRFYDRLSEGTDDLSEEARRRVADARHRALEARDAASRRMRDSRRAVSDGYDNEPLIFGAAAFAVGAGLACLLPRTRQEDEMMGSYSDQLFAEAEAIFNEEKAKVQSAVSAGLNEAKSAAADVTTAARNEMTADASKTESGQSRSSGTAAGSSTGAAGSN